LSYVVLFPSFLAPIWTVSYRHPPALCWRPLCAAATPAMHVVSVRKAPRGFRDLHRQLGIDSVR